MIRNTLVSVTWRGKTHTVMVAAEIGKDGKARISRDLYNKIISDSGVIPNTTFTIG